MKWFRSGAELRLAVVTPFLDRQHGTELCIIEQIERLATEQDWEIHLYSQDVKAVLGLRPAVDGSENSQGSIFWHKVSALPGPHLLNYFWWFFANQWQRRRDRRSGKVRPDLVYSPGINCMDADVIVVHIVFRAFYERVRGELAFNRTPLPSWPRLIHRRLYYKLIMLLERKIYCDPSVRLMAVSSLVVAQLKAHFQRSDVTIIPNGVDTVRFTSELRVAKREASRQSFSYTESDFVLLLIGNDWKKKGFETLLKAVAQLKELPFQLLIVGSDDPEMFRSSLEQLALRDRVRFEKPSSDVLSFYSAADLYVGPSLEDAFGLPILEAMACGLPVIASVHAGVSENIQDRVTGLLLQDPRDHRQLAQLIASAVGDPAICAALGTAAARYVVENCTWDENARRTREFLEQTLRQLSRN